MYAVAVRSRSNGRVNQGSNPERLCRSRGRHLQTSVEYLIFRLNRFDSTEFLFIFAQVVRQGIDDALQMARAHDDSGNQMNTARRVEEPVYDELFGAVGDNHVIAIAAP